MGETHERKAGHRRRGVREAMSKENILTLWSMQIIIAMVAMVTRRLEIH